MKLNILIRTFVISNLYLSLFDIPNKVDSSFIELYVHNDNPDGKEEFEKVIKEFKNKYPNYTVYTVQEEENQQMFMSLFNMIPYYNEDNKWTMLLDDDDLLHEDFKQNFPLIFNNTLNICLKYKCKMVADLNVSNGWYLWHRIYPTKILKQFYLYKDKVVDYLISAIGTTKLSYWEDEIFCTLCKLFTGVTTKAFEHYMIIHNRYDHTIGYPLGLPKFALLMPEVMKLRFKLLRRYLKLNYEKIL